MKCYHPNIVHKLKQTDIALAKRCEFAQTILDKIKESERVCKAYVVFWRNSVSPRENKIPNNVSSIETKFIKIEYWQQIF